MDNPKGKLFLIPTLLSDGGAHIIPEYVKETVRTLDDFVVENEKSARHFLKLIGYKKPLNEVHLFLLNEHTRANEINSLLKPLLDGRNTGLLSEAGTPAIADPGADLVHAAHHHHISVIPLAGSSSITLSLMASGLNGQSFSFLGYLPRERPARLKALKEIDRVSMTKNQTQIFIETPYRNMHLLEDILQTCSPETRLCVACEITGANEFIRTKSILEWRRSVPDLNKRPAIFLIGRGVE